MSEAKRMTDERARERLAEFIAGSRGPYEGIPGDIEALLSKLDALTAERDYAKRVADERLKYVDQFTGMNETLSSLSKAGVQFRERAETAEAQLRDAREALEGIARNVEDATDLSLFRVQCCAFAKATLAKLKSHP